MRASQSQPAIMLHRPPLPPCPPIFLLFVLSLLLLRLIIICIHRFLRAIHLAIISLLSFLHILLNVIIVILIHVSSSSSKYLSYHRLSPLQTHVLLCSRLFYCFLGVCCSYPSILGDGGGVLNMFMMALRSLLLLPLTIHASCFYWCCIPKCQH